MRYVLFSLILVTSCAGVFGVTSKPAPDAKNCPAGHASGKLAPNGSAHVDDLMLTAGDRIVVEFTASDPGDLTAEISGPFITKNGAIKETYRWGVRRMAYEIAKQTHGYYVHIIHESAPTVPRELERQFMLDESCYRHLTVLADNPLYIEEMDKQRARQAESEKEKESSSAAKPAAVAEKSAAAKPAAPATPAASDKPAETAPAAAEATAPAAAEATAPATAEATAPTDPPAEPAKDDDKETK